jgi:uncharacterized protein YbdZ (MbtH family)
MIMDDTAEDQQTYQVVVNDEEQYSIWPADQELPDGWRDGGHSGPKAGCLSYIDQVWTDMRPLSLRKYLAEHANDEPADDDDGLDDGPSLVDRLCDGSHPVLASLRPQASAAALRAAIDGGYVFIRFTDTEGGTELGVRLDDQGTDLSEADFEAGTGPVRLAGSLTLDFEAVRCVATIDLATLTGEGHLQRVDDE